MIKEALQYLFQFADTRIEFVGDREQIFSTQKMHHIPELTPSSIHVRSLSGLVEYLQSKFDGDHELMVHVVSPTEVEVFSTFNRDYNRNVLIKAEAMLPVFKFDQFYDSEPFIIKLQSAFVPNDDRAIMLKLVGTIKEEDVREYGDNGVTQVVTAKTGVAQVGDVMVPNPVVLKPYRTFVEVDQPQSEFIFRMHKGPSCALFEADGGAWKLTAMKGIKEYLESNLSDQIEAGKIVVIA